MNKRRYKQLYVAALLLVLTIPAYGRARNELAYGYDIALVQHVDKEKKSEQEEYRSKKYRYRKEDSYKKEESSRKDYRRKKYMSLKESVSSVKKRVNGRVLSAQSYEEDGHSYHRIKVLTPEGVVRIILMDPEIDDVN